MGVLLYSTLLSSVESIMHDSMLCMNKKYNKKIQKTDNIKNIDGYLNRC